MNIALTLKENAQKNPLQDAVVFPLWNSQKNGFDYQKITFQELDKLSDSYAHGLIESGIKPGMRVLFMIKPNPDFFAITFALFKTGAVPIMIDPGMGIKNFLTCLETAKPEAMIGIPAAHILRTVYPFPFKGIQIKINTSKWFPGTKSIHSFKNQESFPVYLPQPEELAAILFTTGSTGPAKGVEYTHSIFLSQVNLLREVYQFQKGEMEFAGFPLFALFDAALGMTCVIAPVDPTKPASVNPERYVKALMDLKPQNSFGSPAIWQKVSTWCLEKRVKLPFLKKIIMAGAPIPQDLLSRLRGILSDEGKVYTPYGATESLPSTNIESLNLLGEFRKRTLEGKGICVGKPNPLMTCCIIPISSEPISNFNETTCLREYEVGEICMKGPVVTQSYFNLPEQTLQAKIYDEGSVWHRMGDAGYIDNKGNIWFCGRKNHRVVCENATYYTVPCELIFNQHPEVYRSALISLEQNGKIIPAICVEKKERFKKLDSPHLGKQLRELGKKHPHTESIKIFLTSENFPVDIRHNAKIFREKLTLAVQNNKKIKGKFSPWKLEYISER